MLNRFSGTLFLLWLGFAALISQALFVRELLNLFSGNEFSLGVTLAAWLLFTALGAAVGDRLKHSTHFVSITTIAVILLVFLLPLFPVLAIAYRQLAGIPAQLTLTPLQIAVAALLLQSLPSFLFGLLFPLGCSLYGRSNEVSGGNAGQGYALESVGSLIGGLMALFIIVPQYSPVSILLFTGLPGLCAMMLAVSSASLKRVWSAVLSALLLIALFGMLSAAGSGMFAAIEKAALSAAYPSAELLFSVSTRYQRLTLLSIGNQHTVMGGGGPLLSIPYPDDGSSEAVVMIPLMALERPTSLLVIGGFERLPRLAAMFQGVKKVDCIEGDPGLFDAVAPIPGGQSKLGLDKPGIRLLRLDARKFVAQTAERYDAVLVSMPPPVTLSGNRFYTADFFRQMAALLTDKGIAVVVLPGSDTYLSSSSAGMLASVNSALAEAFQFTLAVPGGQTLLIASGVSLDKRIAPEILSARVGSSGISPQFVTADYLRDLLSQSRLEWLQKEMNRIKTPVNRDNLPAATGMALASRMEQQGHVSRWWPWFLPGWSIFPVTLFLLLLIALPGISARRNCKAVWLGAMASTGFVAMAMQVLLMLGYQSRTGMIYQGVALFTALFMFGSAAGVWLSAHMELTKSPAVISKIVEVLFALLASAFFLIFYSGNSGIIDILLPAGGMFAGILTGMEFRAVTRIMGDSGDSCEHPGSVYAADLIGGAMGGALCSMYMIPLAGFAVTCAILATLKMVQYFVLLRLRGASGGFHD